MFIKAYILSIPLFAILVIIPVDCYYFWWCECADNVSQLTTKVLGLYFLMYIKKKINAC